MIGGAEKDLKKVREQDLEKAGNSESLGEIRVSVSEISKVLRPVCL